MAHILAEMFFFVVAFGSVALIALMLFEARTSILLALGIEPKPVEIVTRHPVRVRAAGRWQAAARQTPAFQSREAA